jgi:hypothetical protein
MTTVTNRNELEFISLPLITQNERTARKQNATKPNQTDRSSSLFLLLYFYSPLPFRMGYEHGQEFGTGRDWDWVGMTHGIEGFIYSRIG